MNWFKSRSTNKNKSIFDEFNENIEEMWNTKIPQIISLIFKVKWKLIKTTEQKGTLAKIYRWMNHPQNICTAFLIIHFQRPHSIKIDLFILIWIFLYLFGFVVAYLSCISIIQSQAIYRNPRCDSFDIQEWKQEKRK